jgi:hypothetical protein
VLAANLLDVATMNALIAKRMQMYLRAFNRSQISVRYGASCYHGAGRAPITVTELLKSATNSLCENKGDLATPLVEKKSHSQNTAYATSAGRDL